MNHFRRGVWLACVVLSLALARPESATAQESRGSISGRVIDAQGGVLPSATVTVVNMGTAATTTMTTNAVGQYTALLLEPGSYRVTAELSGFRKTVFQDVRVTVGQRLELDFTLQPQAATETIEVVAETPVLETGSATTGQVMDSKLINEIPLGDGTAYGLTRLVAGATFERSYALQRPDGQRQPARRDRERHHQQRVQHRRHQQRGIAGARGHPAAAPTPSRSSRSTPPSTTHRSATRAPAR